MKAFLLSVLFYQLAISQPSIDISKPIVQQIGIHVDGKSRQYSFTNKEAGTYYGEVGNRNSNVWMGWFVNSRKIFHDYLISSNGRTLDRSRASTIVYPHFLERKYGNNLIERFTFYDTLNIIGIELLSTKQIEITLTPQVGEQFYFSESRSSELIYSSNDSANLIVPSKIKLFSHSGKTSNSSIIISLQPNIPSYCFIVAGKDENEITELSKKINTTHKKLFLERKERMEQVVQRALIITNDDLLNRAYCWSLLSADALIMNQSTSGKPTKGIFAGLPWFNNYWGRDSFISLPGATWMVGNTKDARNIFQTFAKYQDSISTSKTFGRIPNQITTTSTSYNTADATPRFVIQLWEYFKFTGDTILVKDLFPNVRRSIDGAFQRNVDLLGFLMHDDAETWMDATFSGNSLSPRGNRANDIQALWYSQLKAGAEISAFLGDSITSERWSNHAIKVKENFNERFVNKEDFFIYDHLKSDHSTSNEFRPNQLFSLELIEDYIVKTKTLNNIIKSLMFEHGVLSLSQSDSNFHPFHHYEDYYTQDDAYHNGTIWTWLNGAAISALCNSGGQEIAYAVTKNMARQILEEGCVGTLSELVDAHPRKVGVKPLLSGAFSQAWSVAEFNRSMIQDYFGISVDVINRKIIVAPSLPSQLHSATCTVIIENQKVTISLKQVGIDNVAVEANNLPEGFIVLQKLRAVKKRTGWSFAKQESYPYWKSLTQPTYFQFANAAVKQEPKNATILFNLKDAIGDDKGDSSSFTYPTQHYFSSGILDIKEAKISYDKNNLYVNLLFRNLINPGWHPEFGSQLTFSAIALQTGDSGNNNVGFNSNYKFQNDFYFNRLILVGGGLKVVDEKDSVLCEYKPKPTDVTNPLGNIKKKEISFSIPLKFIGTPSNNWKMKILVGAQDDHGGAGIGTFRTVDSLQTEWHGGGKKLSSESNIYDILEFK